MNYSNIENLSEEEILELYNGIIGLGNDDFLSFDFACYGYCKCNINGSEYYTQNYMVWRPSTKENMDLFNQHRYFYNGSQPGLCFHPCRNSYQNLIEAYYVSCNEL